MADDKSRECPICFDVVSDDERGWPSSCSGHPVSFHAVCLLGWASTNPTCPLCKVEYGAVIRSDDAEVRVAAAAPRSAPADDGDVDEDDGSVCARCNLGGLLLVCDGCETHLHLDCAGLREVPEDDWYCTTCAASRAAQAEAGQTRTTTTTTTTTEEMRRLAARRAARDAALSSWGEAEGSSSSSDEEEDPEPPQAPRPTQSRRPRAQRTARRSQAAAAARTTTTSRRPDDGDRGPTDEEKKRNAELARRATVQYLQSVRASQEPRRESDKERLVRHGHELALRVAARDTCPEAQEIMRQRLKSRRDKRLDQELFAEALQLDLARVRSGIETSSVLAFVRRCPLDRFPAILATDQATTLLTNNDLPIQVVGTFLNKLEKLDPAKIDLAFAREVLRQSPRLRAHPRLRARATSIADAVDEAATRRKHKRPRISPDSTPGSVRAARDGPRPPCSPSRGPRAGDPGASTSRRPSASATRVTPKPGRRPPGGAPATLMDLLMA